MTCVRCKQELALIKDRDELTCGCGIDAPWLNCASSSNVRRRYWLGLTDRQLETHGYRLASTVSRLLSRKTIFFQYDASEILYNMITNNKPKEMTAIAYCKLHPRLVHFCTTPSHFTYQLWKSTAYHPHMKMHGVLYSQPDTYDVPTHGLCTIQ